MAERHRSKKELKQFVAENLRRKGLTDGMMSAIIDRCYNEPYNMRTSGFEVAGGTDAIITFSNATRIFSITPFDPSYEGYDPRFTFYAWSGEPTLIRKFEAEEIEIPDEEGLYVIYYSSTSETSVQILNYIKNPTEAEIINIYLKKVIVAWVYWDAENSEAVYFGDERHGSEWNPPIHWYVHQVFNAKLKEGLNLQSFSIGDGSLNAHAQFGVQAGTFFHEDIEVDVSAIASTAGLPVQWLKSASKLPRIETRSGYPVLGSTRLFYNNLTTGAKTQCSDETFVLCHIFASNCITYPVIAVMGTAEYLTKNDAVLAALDELETLKTLIPQQTFLPLGTVIYENQEAFTNSVNARVVPASNSYNYINWNDGSYEEIISEVISEETVPYLKTGWHPEAQSQLNWTWSDAGRTLNIAPLDAYFSYWLLGARTDISSSLEKQVANEIGMHYIYIDEEGIQVATAQWDNSANDIVFASAVYWNKTLARALYVGVELHSFAMEPDTRGNLHREIFTEYIAGLAVTQNATDAWKLDVSDGTIRDEDVVANMEQGAADFFKTGLRALSTHKCWLAYDEAETAWAWNDDRSVLSNIVKLDESNEVQYNALKTGGGYELLSTAEGEFTAVWVLATMDHLYPVKIICGTGKGIDADEAKEANTVIDLKELIDYTQFFCEEYVLLSRVIVKNIAASPYYEIVEINDMRDTDLGDLDDDIYVEDAEYDSALPQITLKRTRNLPDIKIILKLFAEMSIQGDGSSIFPFSLENDESDPGPLYVYATNSNGIKGWWPLFSAPAASGSGSGSGTPGSGADGSGSGDSEPLVPGILKDYYVTALTFDTDTRILTATRSEGLPDLTVEIPGGGEDNYVNAASAAAQSSGSVPAVTNTNNVLKLLFERTGSLADLQILLGSMAAKKFWVGTEAEYNAIGTKDSDTIYHIEE